MESLVDVGGTSYSVTSDDRYLTNVGSTFEPDTVDLFRSIARGVALDVGANIGCTALALSQLCDKVHAFEPVPSTYRYLAANVAAEPKVRTYNMGLGNRNKVSEITYDTQNRSGGFVSDKTKASGGHTVEPIILRKFDSIRRKLGIERVDFVKIDVEGFEGHVLRGMKRTLRKFRPVVTLELNHWCLNAFQRTSVPDFFDYLRSVFPILYAVQDRTYLDLHDDSERYIAMYHHILMGKYPALVGGFELSRMDHFHQQYRQGMD